MSTNFFKVRNGVNVGVLTADPSGGTEGDCYYNSTLSKFREYKNGAWRNAVDEDSTQTLTNKTLTSPVINTPTGITKADVGLGNVDNTSDATKNAAVATLTNKTLTSPVINSPTGIVKGDVGLGNVDNTSDATKNSATATLSNKQVQFSVTTDSTVTGSNATASAFTTGVVRLTNASLVSLSGIPAGSSGQFLILENKTGNQISINNEEVTATAANRIQTGNSSNVSMPNNATFAFTYDSTSSRWQLTGGSGSGSGSGSGKNYLSAIVTSQSTTPNTGNGNFEAGSTLGWSLGTTGTLTNGLPTGSPTFGSGASGNLSIATISSGQLAGSYSLSYASSAATTQGNMLASDAFFIDAEDQAKVLTFKFYYKAQTNPTNANWSGTSSNSFAVAIWDATNSVWLPSTGNFAMTQSSGVGIATGTFQTGITTASLRFVVYNANATSGATTVYFDDFFLGPQTAPIGAVVTDWQSFTPGWSCAASTQPSIGNGSITGSWRRVGDSAQVIINMISGSTTSYGSANAYLFTLPSGLVADTTKAPTDPSSILGVALSYVTGASNQYGGQVSLSTSTAVLVRAEGSGVGPWTSTNPATFASTTANQRIELNFIVPIAGWSSNVQMSNDTDTRIIDFVGYASTNQGPLTSNVTNINLATTKDSAGGWTGSTYVIPVSGDYDFTCNLGQTGTVNCNIFVWVNGSTSYKFASSFTSTNFAGSGTVPNLKAGDVVSFRSDANPTISGLGAGFSVSVARKSGPSVIAATESVNARYYSSVSSVSGSIATVTYATKDFDSHNAYSAGTYTVPVSGKYQINSGIEIIYASTAAQTASTLTIYKNGTLVTESVNFAYAATMPGAVIFVNDIISANAGDLITIRASSAATTPAIVASNNRNYFSIARVGN